LVALFCVCWPRGLGKLGAVSYALVVTALVVGVYVLLIFHPESRKRWSYSVGGGGSGGVLVILVEEEVEIRLKAYCAMGVG